MKNNGGYEWQSLERTSPGRTLAICNHAVTGICYAKAARMPSPDVRAARPHHAGIGPYIVWVSRAITGAARAG